MDTRIDTKSGSCIEVWTYHNKVYLECTSKLEIATVALSVEEAIRLEKTLHKQVLELRAESCIIP